MEFDFTDSKLNNVYATLEHGGESFLVYTKCTPTVCTLCFTDTKDFWTKNLTQSDINAEAKTSKLDSKENYVTYLSDNLIGSDISLDRKETGNGEVLSLLVGKSPALRLDCRRSPDVNGEQELRSLLFDMARNSAKLAKEVDRMKCGARQQQPEYQSGMVMQDFAARNRGAAPKIRRKQGMSVINPNSKKLKNEAKGIVFD